MKGWSREWWQARKHLIDAFCEGKDIKIDGDPMPMVDPKFSDDPEDYTIIEPVNKWLITGWVADKKDHNRKCRICNYYKDTDAPYFVRGDWLNEDKMEKYYTPCESPIANERKQ